jgi:hypothetical protein
VGAVDDQLKADRHRFPPQTARVATDILPLERATCSAAAVGACISTGGDWTPAEEMTRGDLKTSRTGSRTPFQILAGYY